MTSKTNKIELDRHKQNPAEDQEVGRQAEPNLCDSWKWGRETCFRRWKIPKQCGSTEAHYETALEGKGWVTPLKERKTARVRVWRNGSLGNSDGELQAWKRVIVTNDFLH